MADRALPNLGLKGFWILGEDEWKDDNDLNLLKLSVLVQGRVLSKVSATPGAPTDGDVHIFDETHPTDPNVIAIRDAGAWVYVTPLEGWQLYNVAAGYIEQFSGTAWAELATGGSATLAGLTDVDTTGLADGDMLVWNASTAKFEPAEPGTGGSSSGGGNLVFLGEVVAAGGETVLSFTGIDQTYEDLVLIGSVNMSAVIQAQMKFNGDGGANYDWNGQNSGGGSSGNGTTYIPLSYGGVTNYFSPFNVEIIEYAKTDRWKAVQGLYNNQNGTSTSAMFQSTIGGKWHNTGAITQIDLSVSGGTYLAGARVRLYARAKVSGSGGGGSGSGINAPIVDATTARTALLTDAQQYIQFTNAAATTFTIPPNSAVAFAIGTVIEFEQAGAGALTIAAGSGVTINSRGADYTLAGQYSTGFVKKTGTNTWTLGGDL